MTRHSEPGPALRIARKAPEIDKAVDELISSGREALAVEILSARIAAGGSRIDSFGSSLDKSNSEVMNCLITVCTDEISTALETSIIDSTFKWLSENYHPEIFDKALAVLSLRGVEIDKLNSLIESKTGLSIDDRNDLFRLVKSGSLITQLGDVSKTMDAIGNLGIGIDKRLGELVCEIWSQKASTLEPAQIPSFALLVNALLQSKALSQISVRKLRSRFMSLVIRRLPEHDLEILDQEIGVLRAMANIVRLGAGSEAANSDLGYLEFLERVVDGLPERSSSDAHALPKNNIFFEFVVDLCYKSPTDLPEIASRFSPMLTELANDEQARVSIVNWYIARVSSNGMSDAIQTGGFLVRILGLELHNEICEDAKKLASETPSYDKFWQRMSNFQQTSHGDLFAARAQTLLPDLRGPSVVTDQSASSTPAQGSLRFGGKGKAPMPQQLRKASRAQSNQGNGQAPQSR